MAPIKNVLEGRHFFAIGFSGVGTMGVASITVQMDSQEYNMYFRTIRQRAQAPGRKYSRGQALFCSWIFGGGHYGRG